LATVAKRRMAISCPVACHLEHMALGREAEEAAHPAFAVRSGSGVFRDATQTERHHGAAMEFLILTATRTGENLGSRWSEIDSGTWVVPAARMKGRKNERKGIGSVIDHRSALCDEVAAQW